MDKVRIVSSVEHPWAHARLLGALMQNGEYGKRRSGSGSLWILNGVRFFINAKAGEISREDGGEISLERWHY